MMVLLWDGLQKLFEPKSFILVNAADMADML